MGFIGCGGLGYWTSCKDTYKQTGEHRSAQSYMFSANNTAKFLLTYDTSETLRRKMEWFFRDVGTLPKKHGWAVYDVDFEDYTNMCYRGNFPRLKAIKRYLEI
ncbi:hypothetical protein HPB50_010211 [Hyalomma asiaticum]|uniref:Uncharacterized protein n=1 Tax=Hyalomma asiaticum TaxID=266040 RepID=A0ACB7S241_HYAAI|nr:hypothetical protein HPB50_010211 [Hyalomma asiaticum]